MSTNMGNLEKLGILVIVILVVVVGVVAITPKATVDERLYPERTTADASTSTETLEPVAGAGEIKKDDVWPGSPPASTQPLPGPETASATPQPVAAPTMKTIKVQQGDTLASIAKREIGNAANFQQIIDANPGLSAKTLKKGMEIKVPVAATATPSAVAGGSSLPGSTTTPAPVEGGRTYVVKSGDTLMTIAKREMGASSKWPALAKANEGVLHGSTALKIGTKLEIPGDAGAASLLASRDAAPPTTVESGASAGTTTPATSGEREYVVQKGDTLWAIAKREMGGESFVGELRSANQDVLKGGDGLKIGMKLKIPAKK